MGLRPISFGGPPRGKQMEQVKRCSGNHDIYVIECIYIQKDGKIHVINVCRACGEISFHERQIATGGTPAILLKEIEKEK
jgi:hypothetical protein